jgi:hypothetical protein
MTGAAIVAVCLALATIRRPFSQEGLPSGHDATTHINYAYRFDRALHQGQFPVRWVEAYEPGRGQPLFNFYQVGFYYVVEIVHLFIPGFTRAYKFATVDLWWAAALFMFLALKRLGIVPAAAGALVFAISPYMIFDTLERSAFPEFAGIAAGAGALWGIDSLLASGRLVYVPITAALIAALLVSHLPTAVMLTLMFSIHVLAMWLAGETVLRRFVMLAGACGLGAALGAFYVFPALGELSLIQIRSLTQGGFDFHNNFMSPVQWFDFAWKYGTSLRDPDDYMPLQVGIVQWAVILPATVVIIVNLARKRFTASTIMLGAGVLTAAAGLLMAIQISTPIWEHVPPLVFVQFPWRFLMLLPFAGGLLTARLFSLLPDQGVQSLAAIGVVILELHLYTPAMQPQFYLGTRSINADSPVWPLFGEARREFIEPAYFPAGVTKPLLPAAEAWSVQGNGTVRAVSITDARRVFESRGESIAVTLNTPYFPGWTIRVDGGVIAPRVHPGDAFMEFDIPSGTHRVEAAFDDTPIRRWSNVTSCVSAVAMLLLFIGGLVKLVRDRNRGRPPVWPRSPGPSQPARTM